MYFSKNVCVILTCFGVSVQNLHCVAQPKQSNVALTNNNYTKNIFQPASDPQKSQVHNLEGSLKPHNIASHIQKPQFQVVLLQSFN